MIPQHQTGCTMFLTFEDALQQVSALAHVKLPAALHGRLEMATALAASGAVWCEEDGQHFAVRSTENPAHFWPVNGACSCPDAQFQALDGLCKHRISVGLWRRAGELLREPPVPPEAIVSPTGIPTAVNSLNHDIDPAWVTVIHGQPFIKYVGLLSMAHKRGLLTLEARLISVTADLALAEATATFPEGRVFREAADATPQNVTAAVAKHFVRCALTRAKARALRDALGLDMVAVEEVD